MKMMGMTIVRLNPRHSRVPKFSKSQLRMHMLCYDFSQKHCIGHGHKNFKKVQNKNDLISFLVSPLINVETYKALLNVEMISTVVIRSG